MASPAGGAAGGAAGGPAAGGAPPAPPPEEVTADMKRDFLVANSAVIDRPLGKDILRLVHPKQAETPGLILSLPGRAEPLIELDRLEPEMVDRIYRMVQAKMVRGLAPQCN